LPAGKSNQTYQCPYCPGKNNTTDGESSPSQEKENFMSQTQKSKVIFLCTGNSARSQMAEAFLRSMAGEQFEVHSAGLNPQGIHPLTIQVMDEIGLDLADHQSKSVKQYLGRDHFTYLFTVCGHAEENCPQTFLSTGIHRHWDFEDPAAFKGSQEKTLEKFREIRGQIQRKVEDWLAEMGI
jgi:arsenate reductase